MRRHLAAGLLLWLAGCMVGPDYQRPAAVPAVRFKELDGWKQAQPADTLDRGAWWSIYNDPVLDGLERQVATGNQTLAAQEAAFRQAVAAVATARSQLFPTLAVTTEVTRESSGASGRGGGVATLTSPTLGANAGASGTTAGTTTGTAGTAGTGTTTVATTGGGLGGTGGITRTTYSIEGTADWELDLWGRVRRQVESNVAAAQASAADVANARLSAEAQLAVDYFELRAADSLSALLQQTVSDYQRTLQITQNQYNVGVAARGDVITAQTQLAGAQASFINVGVNRAQLEHAIAALTGHAPVDLTIPAAPLPDRVPVVPPGVPSALLERRPDIAAAERTMQAQNAQIGVAVAAFYPQVTLSALFGFAGDPLTSLISAANRVWSLGAAAGETLFEGGARTAAVASARAAYDEAVANYRQTVLTAFEGVEDELSALRVLGAQGETETEAVRFAQRSVEIAINEYKAGTQPFTTVITAQNTLLTNQQAALTVLQDRLVASVTLIENLGGGWSATDLPSRDSLQEFNPLLPGSHLP